MSPTPLHPFCRDDLAHEGSGIAGACKGSSGLGRLLPDARWEGVPCACHCHPQPGEEQDR